jgi:hypothetical protein
MCSKLQCLYLALLCVYIMCSKLQCLYLALLCVYIMRSKLQCLYLALLCVYIKCSKLQCLYLALLCVYILSKLALSKKTQSLRNWICQRSQMDERGEALNPVDSN